MAGECDEQKLKEEILTIVESLDQPRLAEFYSSRLVNEILERLYAAWEGRGRVGEPLDYASCEELETLLQEARRASRTPLWAAFRRLLGWHSR